MAEAQALRQGFSDLNTKRLKVHCSAHPGKTPSSAGTPCIFGPEQEERIVAWVKSMGAMKFRSRTKASLPKWRTPSGTRPSKGFSRVACP